MPVSRYVLCAEKFGLSTLLPSFEHGEPVCKRQTVSRGSSTDSQHRNKNVRTPSFPQTENRLRAHCELYLDNALAFLCDTCYPSTSDVRLATTSALVGVAALTTVHEVYATNSNLFAVGSSYGFSHILGCGSSQRFLHGAGDGGMAWLLVAHIRTYSEPRSVSSSAWGQFNPKFDRYR